MVKNTTGGSGNKKFARKHSSNVKAGMKLRVSEDEGELYAVVTKNLGNNMFHAIDTEGTTYLGHIRGKFSGRGRRDNTIAAGVWVLIGTREWSNSAPEKNGKVKLQQCDLLEVYTDLDKQRLKDAVDENWLVLINGDPTRINKEDASESDVHFQTTTDVERDKLLEEIKSDTMAKISFEKLQEDNIADFDLEVFINDI